MGHADACGREHPKPWHPRTPGQCEEQSGSASWGGGRGETREGPHNWARTLGFTLSEMRGSHRTEGN